MDLFLEILDGPLKGDRTPLRNGLTIGRKDADLNIRDPKASSKHAEVKLKSDGRLFLADLGSANGIRVGDRKVRELLLEAGTEFRLGKTHFRVVDSVDFRESTAPEILVQESSEPTSTWRESLENLLSRAIRQNAQAVPKPVLPFLPPLRLKFKSGLQTGIEWVVGYGPREVGANSLDLQLEELSLPPICFILQPHTQGVLMRVDERAKSMVKVNGRVVENVFIRSGDLIEVKNTRIEVSFESSFAKKGIKDVR